MKMKYLPIVSTVFLILAMMVQFAVSYKRNEASLKDMIEYKMELTKRDIVFQVYDMPDAASEIVQFIPEYGDTPDELYELMETVMQRYPDLSCCAVCYTPYYFPDKGERCAVCALRITKDSVATCHFEDKLDYFQREWYKGAMESDDNGYWSQSYRDFNTKLVVFTYARKAYNQDKQPICVVNVDYSSDWAKELLQKSLPYDDAVCELYSSDDELIVSVGGQIENKDMIVREKVLSPLDMRLVIGVPKHHLWADVLHVSLITLSVLIFGFIIAGLLIRRLWKDQITYTRVETANKIMEHELQIASTIQKGILREGERGKVKDNQWPDVELQAALVPMREVGGDLYDYYRKGDDLFFIIGDVSGKSVPAAMFMSATVNLFRSAVLRLQSPKAIMEEMNAVLSDNNPSMMFVTAFIGRLHIPTGELLYCNAGHLAPIKVQRDKEQNTKGTLEFLSLNPNIPMGYEGQFKYQEQGTMLRQDEIIVLYTDGITEARNEKHEMLGMKRWEEIVMNNLKALWEGRMEVIGEAGLQFVGNAEQADDMTLMTILKTGGMEPAILHTENQMEQWKNLKTAFHNYALCAGLDKRSLKKMEVALEEAVMNVIHYSQAEWIEMTLSIQHSAISIQLTDNGVPFDPTAQEEKDINKAVEERQIGGLGIALIKQIADEVSYRRIEDKNELTIIKNI